MQVTDRNGPVPQRRTIPGPKALTEFAQAQNTVAVPTLTMAPLKERKFAILNTYVKEKDKARAGIETLLQGMQAIDNLKMEGVISVGASIETNRDILCLKYTEEFETLAAGFTDGAIRIFKTDTMELISTLMDEEVALNPIPVTGIKHRPVSKHYPIENVLTCTYASGLVKCWNYNFSQCIYTIREQRQTYGITYHHRLPKFVTYGDDNKIYLYDEETRTQERVFGASDLPGHGVDGHTSKVFAACFNRRSNHELITGGWDDIIHFWDVRQPTSIRHISGVHICGEGLDINQKGTDILTCAWQKENALQIFDYNTGNLKEVIEPDMFKNKLYCGNYLSTDYIICGGTEPHVFRVVDLRRRVSSAYIANLPGGIYCLDIGPVRASKKKEKSEMNLLPRISFCSGKKIFQVDFT